MQIKFKEKKKKKKQKGNVLKNDGKNRNLWKKKILPE